MGLAKEEALAEYLRAALSVLSAIASAKES